MDTNTRQSINKEVDELNLTNIYKTLYPTTAEYTIFSSAHGTSSRIGHMLGNKTNLNKF